MFGDLQQWLAENGNAWPRRHAEDTRENALARWVNNQRVAHGQRGLSDHKVSALEELPGWAWDMHEAQWERMFEKAEAWFYQPPHSRVAPRSQYPVSTRPRPARSVGGLIDKRPMVVLTTLPFQSKSRLRLGQLRCWKEKKALGLARVKAVEASVAQWLSTQRQKHLHGSLSVERAQRLQSLPNWCWTLREDVLETDSAWQVNLERVTEWPHHPLNLWHRSATQSAVPSW